MPPARTLLRNSNTNNDISRRYKNKKAYNTSSTRYKPSTNSEKVTQFPDIYMGLDEFILHYSKNALYETSLNEDKDYPKPNVDLLGGLLSIGNSIKKRKQEERDQALQKSQENRAEKAQKLNFNKIQTKTSYTEIHSSTTQTISSSSNFSINSTDCEVIESSIPKRDNVESLSLSKVCDDDQKSIDLQIRNEIAHLKSPQQSNKFLPEEIKDVDYWDRRKRNNMAAKKSREERRRKELEMLDEAKGLEKENSQLATMLKRVTARNELLEARLQTIRKKLSTSNSDETSSSENSS